MSRISITDVRSLPDALTDNGFNFYLTNIPGASSKSTSNLLIRCQAVSIAGEDNQPINVAIAGHVIQQRGMRGQSHQLQVSFYETVDMAVLYALRAWHEYVVGTRSGNSTSYQNDYKINAATLDILDTTGVVVDTTLYYGLFITGIGEIQLNGAQSQAILVQASFSYDWTENATNPATPSSILS